MVRLKLAAILALCAAPVIASYLSYYIVQPSGRTNYGELIDPQRPLGALAGTLADGQPFRMSGLHGKWVMLTLSEGGCVRECIDRIYAMRQVRATTGKDMERIERVLLVTGPAVPEPALLAQYPGMRVVRGDGDGLAIDRIFVIDPLGNLMMRFPVNADPNRVKRDIAKLLKASRIG